MQEAMVTVELSHVTSNREPYRYALLTVTDAANHHRIVEVALTPQQFYQMISSHQTGEEIPAEVIEARTLAHLGKKTNAFSRTFQRDYDHARITYDGDLNAVPSLVAWAEGMKISLWAHRWSWSSRNNGVNVTFWRYENDLPDSSRKDIETALQAANPPEGLK